MAASVFATDIATILPIGTLVSIKTTTGSTVNGKVKSIGNDYIEVTNIGTEQTLDSNVIIVRFDGLTSIRVIGV